MNRMTVMGAVIVAILALLVHRTIDLYGVLADHTLRVALVRTPIGMNANGDVQAAYNETLDESGIPHVWLNSTDLSLMNAQTLTARYRAIILVDGLNARLPEEATGALVSYVRGGGNVAVIDDAGARNLDGTYRASSLLVGLSGVQSIHYTDMRKKAFGDGHIHFSNAAASARWNVPAGKLASHLRLAGYGYGPLQYQYPQATIDSPDVRVDASGGNSPVITERKIGEGNVAFVALPLGYLRDQTDGFPLRMLLSHFLIDSGALPHLIPTPNGIGQLVINFHIDSQIEWRGIPNLQRHGFLRHSIPMEFDITAGPDRDKRGDGLGFDACGRGRNLTILLSHYGRIGSHGGWAHNEFAEAVEHHTISDAEMQHMISENDACLESVLHQPIRSYAAPAGAHPQPSMSKVLRELGVESYYYTGDTGAPIERPFYGGRIVSEHGWAFPVMPLDRLASIGEMEKANVSPRIVTRWLQTTADYAADHHAIYLVYSHSYDLLDQRYAAAFGPFLDHVEALKRAGHLDLTNMPDAAAFMDRFIDTRSSFSREASSLHVHLENPKGLRSIAFGIPAEWVGTRVPDELEDRGLDGRQHIYSVRSNATTLDIRIPAKHE